jgi:thiol:disulfide interchange protein DsbD
MKNSCIKKWWVRCLFLFCLFNISLVGYAQEDFLLPEQAFQISARLENNSQIQIDFKVAKGYYLYRERFQFKVNKGQLGNPVFPKGEVKFDETFQKNMEVFRHTGRITIPIQVKEAFDIEIVSQGCADAGVCYVPMTLKRPLKPVNLVSKANEPVLEKEKENNQLISLPVVAASSSDMINLEASENSFWQNLWRLQFKTDQIESLLNERQLWLILPLFFLLGLGISFTPCVLPMVPILSSIILESKEEVKKRRAFVLSIVYTLGVSVVYTLLGVMSGWMGESFSTVLHHPIFLGVLTLLLLVLALSMFNLYHFHLPRKVHEWLHYFSRKQSGGKLKGVFVMGAISAFVVGPCLVPPLAGVLLYISQTRDVMLGGMALFTMAWGMSVPLLLIGVSAKMWVPRAGAWMEEVRYFFGALLLALALWTITPLLPMWLVMALWGLLGVGYGVSVLLTYKNVFTVIWAGVFIILGGMQWVGVSTGGRDVWSPLTHLRGNQTKLFFAPIKSSTQLDAVLSVVREKKVMLYFYADWCVSCKEMEKFTFSDVRVHERLKEVVLLRADVTANNVEDKALLKRFGLFGPPAVLFFDEAGNEVRSARVIGYQGTKNFLQALSLFKSTSTFNQNSVNDRSSL